MMATEEETRIWDVERACVLLILFQSEKRHDCKSDNPILTDDTLAHVQTKGGDPRIILGHSSRTCIRRV